MQTLRSAIKTTGGAGGIGGGPLGGSRLIELSLRLQF
jgi:hypothetical protein